MRSPDEIIFRLRQEFFNFRFFVSHPTLGERSWEPRGLPDPRSIATHLKLTKFAAGVIEEAEKVLQGRVSLIGFEFETGSRPAWRRDYVSGRESTLTYFRKIPYLDAAVVGDHKNIWELSRHQHLALLAMAALLTNRGDFADECAKQLESWLEDNPFLQGVNWTSALEVAFRALSWVWILSWVGDRLPTSLRSRLINSLYQHGLYLEYNLSVYFSPNTHLLGEAVVLHLLGRFFPDWPRATAWEQDAGRIVEKQMDFQMQPDGVHFEQSTYYHVYAVDFFLLHRTFARHVPAAYDIKLRSSIEYLRAILGPKWKIPFFGDDDGGRLFHPFGSRDTFGRATMATASAVFDEPSWLRDPEDLNEQAIWWLGPRATKAPMIAPLKSRLFQTSGMAVFAAGGMHIMFDAGPFGWAGAGHSHSDTLSVTVSNGDEELLIDPGTYTYVGDANERDRFRGTGFHNTIRLDDQDQATAIGPFRWRDKPEVRILASAADSVTAHCRYRGLTHRRKVMFDSVALRLTIVDEIEGDGEHKVEQFWHCGEAIEQVGQDTWRIGSRTNLKVASDLSFQAHDCWRSRVLGQKTRTKVLIGVRTCRLPIKLSTMLDLLGN